MSDKDKMIPPAPEFKYTGPEPLLDYQSQSPDIGELSAALSVAQGEMEAATKKADNPFFGSKYADLSSVIGASRPALTKNNLSVVQTTKVDEGHTILVTTLLHKSGQWIRGFYPVNPMKNDPQGMGSAMTYARRYAYAAIVGVTQEDDDGEAAMSRKPVVKPVSRGLPYTRTTNPKLATKTQIDMVYSNLDRKGKTIEDLMDYVKRKFGLETLDNVTQDMIPVIMKQILSLPDPKDPADAIDANQVAENVMKAIG